MFQLIILLALILSSQTTWTQSQPTAEQIQLWQTQFKQLKWLETRLLVKANNIDAITDRIAELTQEIRRKRDLPIAQQLAQEKSEQAMALSFLENEYQEWMVNYLKQFQELEKFCHCTLTSETALPAWAGNEPLRWPRRLP